MTFFYHLKRSIIISWLRYTIKKHAAKDIKLTTLQLFILIFAANRDKIIIFLGFGNPTTPTFPYTAHFVNQKNLQAETCSN